MLQKIKQAPLPNLLVLLTIAMGFCLATYLLYHNPNFGSDSGGYLNQIHNFLNGTGGIGTFYAPGLGILAYPIFLIVNDLPLSGAIVAWLSYLFLLIVVFRLTQRLGSAWSAWLAVLFTAFNPMILQFSYQGMTEMPSAMLSMLTCWLLLNILSGERKIKNYLFLGLATGLSYLIRAQGIVLAGLAFGLISLDLIVLNHQRKGSFKRFFHGMHKPLIMFSLVFCLAFPYIFYLHSIYGAWTISGKIMPLEYREYARDIATKPNQLNAKHIGKLKKEESSKVDISKSQDALIDRIKYFIFRPDRIMHNFLLQAKVIFFALMPVLASLLTVWFIFPFKAGSNVALFEHYKYGRWRIAAAFLVCLMPLVLYWLSWMYGRFVVPFLPLFIVLIALLIGHLAQAMKIRRKGMIIAVAAIVFLLSSFSFVHRQFVYLNPAALQFTGIDQVIKEHHSAVGLIRAGKWLYQNGQMRKDTKIITANKPYVTLIYAHGNGIPLKTAVDRGYRANKTTMLAIELLMSRGDAKYLVLDSYYTMKGPKQLVDLWYQPELAPMHGFKLLHKDTDGLFMIFVKAEQ